MRVDAVIFDLDGTLADTLSDIASAMNRVLSDLGLPTHLPDAYRAFIGEGVNALAERALPPDRVTLVPEAVARFKERYGTHMLDETAPYPGIVEMLDALAARSVRLAVLSNKPDEATRRMVDALFAARFAAVAGQREGVPRKPDPTAALDIARRLAVPCERVALAGDSGVDMRTAVAAGMRAVGVLWGLRDRDELVANGAEALAQHPMDLVSLFE